MSDALEPLLVIITHEPFVDGFDLAYNGNSEWMEHAEALEWFKKAGAKNIEAVNEAINHAWNFGRAEVTIGTPNASVLDVKLV